MFSSRNKKNIDTFWLKKAPYQELYSYVAFVLLLFVLHFSFQYLGKGVLYDCGISWDLHLNSDQMHFSSPV